MRQTFTKDERLRKKILIAKLFQEGSSFFVHPFRITWISTDVPGKYPAQVLVSVPKQLIRKAVNRNKIKRRMREAYRKNKFILYDFLEQNHITLILSLTYTSKEILPYDLVQEKIIVLLHRLRIEYAKSAG
jgi:ribonuclease P protein component